MKRIKHETAIYISDRPSDDIDEEVMTEMDVKYKAYSMVLHTQRTSQYVCLFVWGDCVHTVIVASLGCVQ
jgi:hypothetical protein